MTNFVFIDGENDFVTSTSSLDTENDVLATADDFKRLAFSGRLNTLANQGIARGIAESRALGLAAEGKASGNEG